MNRTLIVTSPTTYWAMPRENFELYTIFKHKNTLQIHRFIQNNNRNTHAAYTGKTHKNKCINNNAACNLTHN
jgi:hypothetical protein